jgi:hypothetical protein
VCETIFDVMLSPYISGLEACHERSNAGRGGQGSKRPSIDEWDQALESAEEALAIFRKAEGLREGGDVHSANASVEEACLALKKRYASIHQFHPLVLTLAQYRSSSDYVQI